MHIELDSLNKHFKKSDTKQTHLLIFNDVINVNVSCVFGKYGML